MANWVVWAGNGLEDIIIRDEFVGIGFGGAALGDISVLPEDELRERVFRARPRGITPGGAGRQLLALRDSIEVGDYLLVPLLARQVYHIGEVTGPYQFVESRPYPHCRSVKWHRTNITRDGFRIPGTSIRLTRPTVYRLRKHADTLTVLVKEAMEGNDRTPWGTFIARARAYYDTGRLEEEEINYKVEFGKRMQSVSSPVLAGANGWAEQLHKALLCNFIRWGVAYDFRTWCRQNPSDALAALSGIWAKGRLGDPADQIRAFSDGFPNAVRSGVGTRLNTYRAC